MLSKVMNTVKTPLFTGNNWKENRATLNLVVCGLQEVKNKTLYYNNGSEDKSKEH